MKCSPFSLSTRALTLLLIALLPATETNSQDFQRLYGTNLDNAFTKVIQHGSNYYVLGQDQTTSGGTPHATVSRLDANGIHQWTLSLNIPSTWNDAVLTPAGDLLVVGNTLPGDASNNSIMGLVTTSGGGNFTWLRTYDVPGREGLARIIRNPNPQNASFPYYVIGSQFDANGPATWDDIILMNINAAGTFNWKKRYTSVDDDEFGRDLEVLSNGDMMISGNHGSQGVIYKMDNAGTLINGITPSGLSFSYADVAQSSGGGFYAVGNTFPSFTPYLMKYDNNLLTVWDATISGLTSINQVWEEASGGIYVVGHGVFHGLSRAVLLRFTEVANTPSLDWVKYLDNSETSYSGGSITYLTSGQIAFVDGRTPSTGGFGQLCAFMSVSDADILSCMTGEDFTNALSLSLLYDAPALPAIEFFDFPTGTDILSAALNWQQEDVCDNNPCSTEFIITPIGNCGHYQVTTISNGASPFLYTWCDGSTFQNLDVQLPCGPNLFCVTITDSEGCTASYSESITVTDNIPPIARCALPFGVVLNSNCQYFLTPGQIDGGSSDNCQIQSLSISPAILTGCGVFPITLTVTDWCGNTSTCTTDVQAIEDVPPVIVCPQNVTVTAATSPPPCSTVVNGLSWLSATDNCGTPFVDYVVTGATSNFGQNDASGLTYNQGVSTVTYIATDACGNTASCSFTVTVICLPLCDTLSIILNTGWDNLNAVVISPSFTHLDLDGAPGLDWIVTADPITTPPPGGRPANVPVNQNGPSWANPFQNSQWICSAPDWYTVQLPNPPYLFTYEITFDLPPGYFNPNIDLQMRADELIHTVSLNNNVIYQFFPPQVAGGFNGPPLLVNNNTPSFFQTTQNKLTVSYSDESGGVTGFNLAGKVTYCKDTCICGTFSDMAIRFERGPGMPLTCGGPPVLIDCPPPGYTYSITGKFECQGKACPLNTPFDAQIELPNGQVIHYQGQSANPYFGIPISNLDLQQAGVYTVSFTGHCGTEECKCVVRFQVDSPCIDRCPCTIPDIQAFSAAVNQGFAQVLYSKSCKACFTPIALGECESVEWYLNNTGGSPIGTSSGGNTFCYVFPGSGTYSVIMVVTRRKDDGTNCETFVKSQNVMITCINAPVCVTSVFDNPTFSEGAVEGGLSSGGHSDGWKASSGNPKLKEDQIASVDGWTMLLSGNLDTADVLTRFESICLEKSKGVLRGKTVKGSKSNSDNRLFPSQLKFYLGSKETFKFNLNECNGIDCYELASIALPVSDTGEWLELEVPYDLSNWEAFDTCGGVLVRPYVFVTNTLSNSQGGAETYSYVEIDNLCVGGTLVAVEEPIQKQPVHIYPNPNTGEFYVEMTEPFRNGMTLRIISLTGQVLINKYADVGLSIQNMEASSLPEGMYFIQIISDGRLLSVEKFVKQ